MRPFADYPSAWGAQRASVFPHRGPSTYVPITPGVAPANATGGDPVYATEAGMKFFDFVIGGLSDSGVYRVECIPVAPSGAALPVGYIAQPSRSYILRWVVVATGAEAGAIDLDAEIVRLLGVGPK